MVVSVHHKSLCYFGGAIKMMRLSHLGIRGKFYAQFIFSFFNINLTSLFFISTAVIPMSTHVAPLA